MKKTSSSRGFTIVELLVVIVVIGILAAITVVAYNGIQSRAQAATVSSALDQTNRKLALYVVDNSAYPPDLSTIGIANSGITSYQYSFNNSVSPQTYCVTATYGTTSYKSSSTAPTPTNGGCPGHGIGGVGAVTNLLSNPSFEANTSGWIQGPNATIAQWGGQVYVGTSSAIVSHINGAVAGNAFVGFPVSGLTIGIQYTVSFWTRMTGTGNPNYWALIQDTGPGGPLPPGATTLNVVPTGTWTKYSLTWTADQPVVYFLQDYIGPGAGESYGLDAVMFTKGSTVYGYADGNSPNWAWTGLSNNSTSTGPGL